MSRTLARDKLRQQAFKTQLAKLQKNNKKNKKQINGKLLCSWEALTLNIFSIECIAKEKRKQAKKENNVKRM